MAAAVCLGETAVERTHKVNDRLVIAEIPNGTDRASTSLSVMDGSTRYNIFFHNIHYATKRI